MGCASSKTDELPAVILCRERLDFLSDALHQRYTFAEAHVAYIDSLSTVGVALHRFFDSSTAIPPPSPAFNLPSDRKVPAQDDDDGHLEFHSESDDDDGHLHLHDIDESVSGSGSGSGSLHHHHDEDDEDSLPSSRAMPMMYNDGPPDGGGIPGFNPYLYSNGGNGNGFNFSNMNVHYMKKHVTPSVSYEQRPIRYQTQTVQFGDPNASSSSSSNATNYYDYFGGGGGPGGGYANNSNNNSNAYMNYGGFYGGPPPPSGGGGGGGGGYGGWNGGVQPQQPKPKAAPPPPPPPATSPWDFMNLFESIDNHYPPYTPSRDSREVREEEGIPDLEDEDHFDHEVVKQVHGNQKLVDDFNNYGMGKGDDSGGSSSSISSGHHHHHQGKSELKGVEKNEEVVGVSNEAESSLYRARVSASTEAAAPVEYDVHVVDKKVVGKAGKADDRGGKRPEFRNVFELVKEIQIQFERAAASGDELTKVLEVGKLRYHRKTGAYQVSAKMLNAITPSLPSSSKDDASVNLDEDVQLKTVNLSATLQKLYLWEKKLFEEVKIEEKMRVQHDRKTDRLKQLTEKGAEPQKIEATRDVVRGLSTKIKIAIQIVDRISAKINKLRDEELWPQLSELIQGYL